MSRARREITKWCLGEEAVLGVDAKKAGEKKIFSGKLTAVLDQILLGMLWTVLHNASAGMRAPLPSMHLKMHFGSLSPLVGLAPLESRACTFLWLNSEKNWGEDPISTGCVCSPWGMEGSGRGLHLLVLVGRACWWENKWMLRK